MGLETFKAKCVAVLVTAIGSVSSPSYADSLVPEFENLFERCRASIETNSVFDSEGLQRRTVAERHAREWGISSTQEAWTATGSEFYVVLTEWTSRDGTTRHLCDIELANEAFVLGPTEQALLLRHFLIEKVQLIGAGTHKVDQLLSPIPPAVNAGFLLSDRNPNGCIVSSGIAFAPDGTFFSAGSGEQAVQPCENGQ